MKVSYTKKMVPVELAPGTVCEAQNAGMAGKQDQQGMHEDGGA